MVETASEARETADEAREAVEAALPAGERPGTSRVRTNDYGRELAEQVERGDDPVTVALGDLPGRLRTLAV